MSFFALLRMYLNFSKFNASPLINANYLFWNLSPPINNVASVLPIFDFPRVEKFILQKELSLFYYNLKKKVKKIQIHFFLV